MIFSKWPVVSVVLALCLMQVPCASAALIGQVDD